MTTMFKARPTVYNGIEMRSRLEAGYASWLDRFHFDWEYEPQCFAGPRGQYLPDFRLNNVAVMTWAVEQPTTRTVYIECKPLSFWSGEGVMDFVGRAVAAIHANEPDAWFLLETPPHKMLPPTHLPVMRIVHTETKEGWAWDRLAWCFASTGLGLVAVPERSRGPWEGEWWKGPAS